MGKYEFLNRFALYYNSGAEPILKKFVLNNYQFYDDFGTHFSMIFDEKNLHRSLIHGKPIEKFPIMCYLGK